MAVTAIKTSVTVSPDSEENFVRKKSVSMTAQATEYARTTNVFVRTATSEKIVPYMSALITALNTELATAKLENAPATQATSERTALNNYAPMNAPEKEAVITAMASAPVKQIIKEKTALTNYVQKTVLAMDCALKMDNVNVGILITDPTVR